MCHKNVANECLNIWIWVLKWETPVVFFMHSMRFPLTSLCKASCIQQCNYGYKEAARGYRSEEEGKNEAAVKELGQAFWGGGLRRRMK